TGGEENLNAQAVEDLLRQRLAPNGTNHSYRKNQLRFLEWAIQHNKVSFTAFSLSEDLVNFLADMKTRHDLQEASTLKTLRAAVVAHLLHEGPKDDSRVKEAPPVNLHRPTIDVSPAIAIAQSIASRTTTFIKRLQRNRNWRSFWQWQPSYVLRIWFVSLLPHAPLRILVVSLFR
ncbi:hypothetical protein HMPREF1544_12367, partial [Mucor circinelloides 1006PhL]